MKRLKIFLTKFQMWNLKPGLLQSTNLIFRLCYGFDLKAPSPVVIFHCGTVCVWGGEWGEGWIPFGAIAVGMLGIHSLLLP